MDHREQERQSHLVDAEIFITRALTTPEKEFKTILEYRYARWNLTMKAIRALFASLRVRTDEVDYLLDTVSQASAGQGWRITE